MSIKTVNCPLCKQSINVPPAMASAKCPVCGSVFSVAAAQGGVPIGGSHGRSGATTPNSDHATERSTNQSTDPTNDSSESRLGQWMIVGGVALLCFIGVVLLTVFRFSDEPEVEKPEIPMRTQATVVEELNLGESVAETEYRVVDLPETTRLQIYRDYTQMIGSSFGKAKKIPKSGAAGQSLNKTLGAVADREVTHMALIHGISEDDIAQIYAEGQSKGW